MARVQPGIGDAYKPSGITPSGSNVNMGSSSYLPTANIGGNSVWDTKLSDKQTQDAKKLWEKRNNTPEKGFMESLGDVGSSVVNGIKGVGEFVGNEALGVDDFGWVAKNLAQGNLLEAGKSALAGGLELGGTVASVLGAIPSGGTSLGWFAAKQGAKKVAKEALEDAAKQTVKRTTQKSYDDAFEAITKGEDVLSPAELKKFQGIESVAAKELDDAVAQAAKGGDKELTKLLKEEAKRTRPDRAGKFDSWGPTSGPVSEAMNATRAADDVIEAAGKATNTWRNRLAVQKAEAAQKSPAELAKELLTGRPSVRPRTKLGTGSGKGKGSGSGSGGGLGSGSGGGSGSGLGTGSGAGSGPGKGGGILREDALVGARAGAETAAKGAGRGVDDLPPPPSLRATPPRTTPKVLPGGTSTGEAVETVTEQTLKSIPEDVLNPGLMGPQFKRKIGLGLDTALGLGTAGALGMGAVTNLSTNSAPATSMGTATVPNVKTNTTFADGTPIFDKGGGGGGGGLPPTLPDSNAPAAPSDIPYIY